MSVLVPVVESWDGELRRFFLKQGVTSFHWIDDIYAEYRNWRATDEESRKWLPFMKASGNEPKGGGKFTPRYLTVLDNARCVPFDENILITALGEAITDNPDIDPDPFDTSNRTQPLKLYITPAAAEIVRDVKSLEAIGHMEFNDMVYINSAPGVGYTGTGLTVDGYQIGTLRFPCNNLTDAKQICLDKGFNTLRVKGNFTVNAGESLNGYIIVGDGVENTKLTLTATCTTSKTEFMQMSVSGFQDGETHYDHCEIKTLGGVHCKFEDCLLVGPMTMEEGTYADTTVLVNCYTGWDRTISSPASKDELIVDMYNSSVNMAFNNFYGKIKFKNLSQGPNNNPGVIALNVGAGKVTIDSSCTAGTIKIRGNCEIIDNSNGTTIDKDTTDNLVWQHAINGGTISAEQMIQDLGNAGGSLTVDQNNKLMSIPTESVIASAVDTLMAPRFSTVQPGLTENQAVMLIEIYRLMGLDPTRPLIVNQTERIVGEEVVQTIEVDDQNLSTTVTRNMPNGVSTLGELDTILIA